jgi:UDP-N-acetylglucosamine 2-epimerase (hydrolysing)
MKRKLAFLTGTRADFGKIKSLLQAVDVHPDYDLHLFVTGMHLMPEYGYTFIEVERAGVGRIHTFENHTDEATMELTLARTIEGFSAFVRAWEPDLIVVHGDRVEALAGAIVGSLNNILVAHIEGGEISGTIDELLRHATSKMSHFHLVANKEASRRLVQMGEDPDTVIVMGSPDIDIMLSQTMPDLDEVKRHYEIGFENYGLVLFHPVTTEYTHMARYADQLVNALLNDHRNYVVIFPNNDMGSTFILEAYKAFEGHDRFRVFPSIRFEYFLTLLRHAELIIGNSSAGIREAPYYGVPTINIGSRQDNRAVHNHIVHTDYTTESIKAALDRSLTVPPTTVDDFGQGNSSQLFMELLGRKELWMTDPQKQFIDRHG